MVKICFVTAARSEYGLLKWLMHDVAVSNKFEFQLIVTGGHLSYEQGHTIDQIIEDGFEITEIVDADLDTSCEAGIAESMGRMSEGFAKVFDKITPDYVVVLGDRYELLPICSAAFVMKLPIIHISGGDVTEGAIDNGIRNAITMLADFHFPGTQASADNIISMRGSNKHVWVVGELGLDAFNREKIMSREALAENLSLDIDKKWILMTYHAETRNSLEYNLKVVNDCIDILFSLDGYQTVITYANADFGGEQINQLIEKRAKESGNKFRVISSLGHLRYLSYMQEVSFVIGNSSSGIVEAPFLNIPVINIGNRQKGRYQCGNIIQSTASRDDILRNVNNIISSVRPSGHDTYYWGDGHASERIIKTLEAEIC